MFTITKADLLEYVNDNGYTDSDINTVINNLKSGEHSLNKDKLIADLFLNRH